MTQSTTPRPLTARLLEHVCTGGPFDWQPQVQRPAELAWLLEAGLGPLLRNVCADAGITVPSPWVDSLTSADLTARVLHAGRVDTVIDVIDACAARDVAPLLLKGVSTSGELWPAEHLRPMSDIDVLIPLEHLEAVERGLLDRGLERLDHPDHDGLHHGAPLFAPARHAVVELHRALLPRDSAFAAGSSLTAEEAWAHAVPAVFHGRAALRLRPEFQLVYIASAWFADLIQHGVEPSYLPSLFDAAWLFRRHGAGMDWDVVLQRLANPFVRGSVHLLLGYLPRFGAATAPASVRRAVAAGPMFDGPMRGAAIHWMLDRYLIGGHRWPHLLPPPVPGRYSPGYQFRKRVVGTLRRLSAG